MISENNTVKEQYDDLVKYVVSNDDGNNEKLYSFIFNGVSVMTGGKLYNKVFENLNNIDIIRGYRRRKKKERQDYNKKVKKIMNSI